MANNIKIMIVEDEALTAMVMQFTLRDLGYLVCKPVATGEEAVQTAVSENPDMVLMDIHLAGSMDGIDAAGEILHRRAVPIIFITGYSDREVRERADRLHPFAYLQKPLEMSELASHLDRWFKDR
jgi:two-component system, response regulator PdtaR